MKKFLTFILLIPVIAYAKDLKQESEVNYYEKQYKDIKDLVDERYSQYMNFACSVFPDDLNEQEKMKYWVHFGKCNAYLQYWVKFGMSMAYSDMKLHMEKTSEESTKNID